MHALLFIPWFKAEAWEVPIPGTEHVLPIQPFGVLVAIGVLLGAKISEVWGKRNGISAGAVNDMVGHVVIGGFLGGYFLNAAFYHPDRIAQIIDDPSRLFSIYLGLSSFGGYVGAISGLLLWWARRRISPIAVGEAACFGFPFAWIFGRSGCFVTHDHPGAVTDFPLAVADYQVGYPPFEARHDLGLYEVFWALAISGLFVALSRKKRRRGFYMAALPISYAPIRFFLDYLRAQPEEGGDVRYAALTPGQWGSFALLAVGLFVLWWIATHEEPTLPASVRWPPEDGVGDGDEQPDTAAGEPADADATGDGEEPGDAHESGDGEEPGDAHESGEDEEPGGAEEEASTDAEGDDAPPRSPA